MRIPPSCWGVMALACLGCGAVEDREPAAAVEIATVAGAPATPPAPLRVEVHAAPAVQGRPVPLELVVRNVGRTPAALGTGDSATTFDLVVTGRDGRVVWNRLHAIEEIPLVLIERIVPPGGTMRFTDRWDLRDNTGRPVPPGTYSVYGLVDTNESADLRTAARPLVVGLTAP
ncbi:MAG TPA: hypothetical protein VGC13_25220 [Longimicrobium sp.]